MPWVFSSSMQGQLYCTLPWRREVSSRCLELHCGPALTYVFTPSARVRSEGQGRVLVRSFNVTCDRLACSASKHTLAWSRHQCFLRYLLGHPPSSGAPPSRRRGPVVCIDVNAVLPQLWITAMQCVSSARDATRRCRNRVGSQGYILEH